MDYLSRTVPLSFEDRRKRTASNVDRLRVAGVPVAPELAAELEALAQPAPDTPWSQTIERLAKVETGLRKAEAEYVQLLRTRAVEVARWAGLAGSRLEEFERQVETAALPAREGRLSDAIEAVTHQVRQGLPEAVARRNEARDTAGKLAGAAKEQGVPTSRLESTLREDSDAPPERWPETVPAIEAADVEVGEILRERCGQSLDALRISLDGTAEFGVDVTAARVALEDALAHLPTASPLEIPPLLQEARRVAEEPIVSVVAGLLDEVRPRIAEARRLGRDPSDVFAAMNRAREALRLKIYSEALAASQEALDRVARLTEDLETVRDELAAVDDMVRRFRKASFSTEPFEAPLLRARGHLDRSEVDQAREILNTTVVQLGREALQFFLQRWGEIDQVREFAREHGFLTPEVDRSLAEVRELLEKGQLAEGAEHLAQSEVELRAAAGPYVARRVEEMQKGFQDISDEALTSPVRRLLADADVTLRVKEDLPGAIDSLRRAERDFAAVFASHASALVEELEAEGRILESMGGASDEIQRQIDEVQQIFNMGDFVKASRASQEIRTRAQQQQLVRSEESVSHAKLSLVELETMGLDLTRFRGQLDEAQAASRAGKYAEAYRIASKLEETAGRTRAHAQTVIESINRAQELLTRLRDSGTDPTPFYEPLRLARLSFQSLDFDAAHTTVDGILQTLLEAQAHAETDHLFNEIDRLLEDGRRLSTPMEPFADRLKQLRTEQPTAPAEATHTGARLLHEELIATLRPILEENQRSLERDLDIARSVGLDVEKIVVPLGEARRRIALPVPIGAASLLDAARSEFVATRGFVEHAERLAKRAREALAQADLLHVSVGPLRDQMDRVEQALAGREYARVIELGGPIERELLQQTYQHVSKTLAHFQATVTHLRHEGGETSVAENLLHQARMALDEGRPVEALQLASKSEAELERVDLQRRIAEGSLEATERAIARSTEEGVVAATAAEEFQAAKVAFVQHAYPDVLERAIAASEAIGFAHEGHRRAGDALASAERQVNEAVEMGADVTEARARLAEGRHANELGQYSEAVRAGREATEIGRWAIERIFAGPIGELRQLVEGGRTEGLGVEIDPIEAVVGQAEAALRAREWPEVREAVERGGVASRRIFESIIDGRWREVEAEFARTAAPSPAEAARREEIRAQLATLRERKEYASALALARAELTLARQRRREELDGRAVQFKDRLWVGERLGVDTTPMMQTFSEAKAALDAGRLDEAETLLARASTTLVPAVKDPFARRLKDLQVEVTFAQEGLHVIVGSVRDRLREVDDRQREGDLLEAGRILLRAEEELNLRKSLHRELLNLHYLIDAALTRAHERRIDTAEARQLLAESLRLRDQDYVAALEKAREALRKLQDEGAANLEPAPATAGAWSPFRRPPGEP
jgi:hypothetical protein